MGGEKRREIKSLRIGVHHADAVVWEPVYRTRLALLDVDPLRLREPRESVRLLHDRERPSAVRLHHSLDLGQRGRERRALLSLRRRSLLARDATAAETEQQREDAEDAPADDVVQLERSLALVHRLVG
eukprot:31551-Pelagococcus_subviridis.AAC.15